VIIGSTVTIRDSFNNGKRRCWVLKIIVRLSFRWDLNPCNRLVTAVLNDWKRILANL
jgi:hypothetical protein